MQLDVLRSAFSTIYGFCGSIASMISDLRAGQHGAAAGDLVSALPFLIPFIIGIIFVFAIRKKWKPFLIALLCVLLYGGMEYLVEKGSAAGSMASAAVLLGKTSLILGLTMFLFLFLYGMFHRRSRRRDDEENYDDYYADGEEEEPVYEDLNQ